MRYSCQLQEIISYTDYFMKDTNTIDNGKSTNKWGTNSTSYGNFSYLVCDTRVILIPWHNTLIIDHYPVELDCVTVSGPDMYIFPFRKFLRISEARVWSEGLIIKDIEISDQTLSPFWESDGCSRSWIKFGKLIKIELNK